MNLSHLFWKEHHHIGVDLDETLASTVSGMIEHAQSKGHLLHITSIDQVKKHDASGLGNNITSEEATLLWEDYGKSTLNPLTVPPMEDAIE